MAEKTIPKNQTLLFRSMQREAQKIIGNNQKLLNTQTWATHRASLSSVYNESAIRSIYWFLSINIDRARSPIRVIDFSLARGKSVYGYGNKIRPSDKAYKLARALDDRLNSDLTSYFTSPFTYTLYRDLNSELDRTFICALNPVFVKKSFQYGQGIEILELDIHTLYLVQISSIFRMFSEKKRSQAPIHKMHAAMEYWQRLPGNPFKNIKLPSCPTQYSDFEWINFHQKVREMASKVLELDLLNSIWNNTWNDKEFETTDIYLVANQLMWDCLQDSKVEDHEIFEVVLLNQPK